MERTMLDKDDIARMLAEAHRVIEPAISRVIRLLAEREEDAREPVKLLEVNPMTSPSGVLPIAFTADPPRVPYPSVIIEVTEAELERINAGTLALPVGWRLGRTLYPAG
ncbi:MAG: hypothetical protein U0359_22660 [Byssovorax sp.]